LLNISKKQSKHLKYEVNTVDDKLLSDDKSRYYGLKFLESAVVTDSLWIESFERKEIPESDNDLYIEFQKGDRLDLLSFHYYGTSRLWWAIAIANNIQNPFKEIKPGTMIRIPDINLIRR